MEEGSWNLAPSSSETVENIAHAVKLLLISSFHSPVNPILRFGVLFPNRGCCNCDHSPTAQHYISVPFVPETFSSSSFNNLNANPPSAMFCLKLL
jgi:hypothetical protein